MIKSIVLLLATMTLASIGYAQYFQFSQYNYGPQRVTPTAPVDSDYAQLSFIFRNQATGGGLKLNSNLLSASYPFLNRKSGRRWSGLGMTLMDDRSGGFYVSQEATMSYAVNIFLKRNQTLSLGMKGLFQQRRLDLAGFTTESQFVPDRGFDESLSNGEPVGVFRNHFFTMSTGITWQHFDKKEQRTGYLSLSLFDLNKRKESFFEDDSQLNSTFVFSGGFRAAKSHNLSIWPELLLTNASSATVVNAGFITRCDVPGTRTQAPFYIDIITRYVVGRSGILGLQFHNEKFSFGFSYDLLVHRDNPANVGAFEIGLLLKRLVIPKKSATKPRTTASQKPKAPPSKPQKPPTAKKDSVKQIVTPKKDLVTNLQNKKDSILANAKAGEIRHEPFMLEKVILHFNFEFNSSDLDGESADYLDELTEALLKDKHLRISLTGHTDNIGSAKFNERLSLVRANAVKDHLVSRGVSADRIVTEGKGMSAPLNDNKTEADRAKNRRVELMIFYQE